MDFNEIVIYGKTKFSDILKEIHLNQQSKEEELKGLILDLKEKIETPGDAMLIVPLLAKYIDAQIKNDDTLIKMISIVQRAIARGESGDGDGSGLTEEERNKLYDQAMKVVG